MDVSYVNAFIESIDEYFQTMLNARVSRDAVTVASQPPRVSHLCALIGFSGATRGTALLVLPTETAQAIVRAMLMMDDWPDEEVLRDGVAEAVNIVAGGAKAKLPQNGGVPAALSLPTVIRGEQVAIDSPSDAPWVAVEFSSNLGPFCLHLSFQSAKPTQGV